MAKFDTIERMVDHARLVHLLHYSPETGEFIRKQPGPAVRVGQTAGSIDAQGYIVMKIDGKAYKAHRLAWLYVTGKPPAGQIDHVNTMKTDNRFANLREATNGQNSANKKSFSKYGLKGVSIRHRLKHRPWVATITHNKKKIYLGTFKTAEEAHSRYCEEAKKLHAAFFHD